ncbi:unnamed protein product [Phytomonas sp. Hart1]|nr:unnamed protein product [Phytomonas sp. Hart1]|eukprot:CCW66044.1 unnamed protein product [Phytomonas sp. isolate Hart1]
MTPSGPHRSRLEWRLMAVELALGRAPVENEVGSLPPSLIGAVEAVRTADLPRLDAVIRENGGFYVEIGIYNVMMVARGHVMLLMVMKFYLHTCSQSQARSEGVRSWVDRLEVAKMIKFYHLPYRTVAEATVVWLLPLLVNRKINGFVEGEYLHINPENPFDGYNKALFETALETYED